MTDALDRANEPVILVAHSLGGIAPTVAAESRPQAISRTMFINSLLPRDGEGAFQTLIQGGPDCVLLREGALITAEDGMTISVDSPGTAIDAFYNCCDPAAARQAASQVCPEPLPPLRESVSVTAARFGSVPNSYIGAKDDHILPWVLQQRMSDTYSAKFVELDGHHSPFLSATDDLLAVLTES